ncbi:ABC transporter substrate-binding protein [Sulfitobacter geojensis]|uniref:ABC transporter substrate-binding protein n=1 Tax=Sulfitobacter geojensis TaxID=1342299 RepID=UPI0036DB7068
MRLFLIALTLIASTSMVKANEALRLSVLKFGTVNWELDTIRHNQLDKANGFTLDVRGVSGNPASMIAFQGGEADMMVSDWIWVARQRAAGKDYVYIPYSKSVGSLMVATDSPVQTLSDLRDMKIGIAGGPLDKSWLILQAYSKQTQGFDLGASSEQVFGAPPLVFKKTLQGELQGAINFWHFQAKMKAKGFRELVSVADAAQALGLDPDIPLLGYVVKGDFLRANPDLVAGFVAASRAAKRQLATDDAEWDRLRPRMKADNEAAFEALKAGFRAGIPDTTPIDRSAASDFLALMAELGGEKLVGKAKLLPDGIFYTSNN